MATPFVAGLALLMLDQNPALSPGQVKSALMATAIDWGSPGGDNTYGAGRLDAYAALQAAGAPIAAPPTVPYHLSSTGVLPSPGASIDVPLDLTGTGFPLAATLLTPSGGATLVLLDPAGTPVASSASADEQEELGYSATVIGGYVVRITSTGGAGAYSLDLSGQFSLVPKNVAPPAISGVARDGSTLTALSGGWASSLPLGPYAFAWQRCDRGGAGCAAIPGATATAYTATRADVGQALRVVVTASNSAGSASAASNAVGIGAQQPSSRTVPTISGIAKVGRTLRAHPGRWAGSGPLTFRYQWLRCGTRICRAIKAATRVGYKLRRVDAGKRLRVRVSASNSRLPSGGSAARTSLPSRRVRR
jgi:hypothetical protein